MPHTFVVPSRRVPAWGPVSAEVGLEGLVVAQGAPAPEWPLGVLHVHETGTSARGIEVEHTAEGMRVRIPASAAPTDWDLGLRFVRAFAGLHDAPIHRTDRAAPFDAVELAARYHGKALAALLAAEFDATALAAASADGPLTLAAAVRPVHLGPATIARLRDAGPPEERGLRLADLVGRIQWIEQEGYAIAGVFPFVSPDGRAFSAAAIVPGRRLFLPASPHVLLAEPGSSEAPLVVPRASLPAWIGEGLVEALDETQALVLIHKGSAWDDAWDRAAAHVIVRVQKTLDDVEPAAPPDEDLDEDLEVDLDADEATHEGPTPPLAPPPLPGRTSNPPAPRRKAWWKFW